jgi:tryptophan-rich sensory protein
MGWASRIVELARLTDLQGATPKITVMRSLSKLCLTAATSSLSEWAMTLLSRYL